LALSGASKQGFAVAAVLLLAGLAIASLWRSRATPVAPARSHDFTAASTTSPAAVDREGFVGSEACAECHADVAEQYFSHPMALSMRAAPDDRSIVGPECQTLELSGGSRTLAVSCDGTQIIHHERMYDADGELLFDLPYRPDYVAGSGAHAKAFLMRRGNVLLTSPLNWYAEDQRWDLAPGYQPDDPRRFDRRVRDDCLACHAGRTNSLEPGSHTFAKTAFAETRIGCERCHGPGQAHIDWHHNPITRTSTIDPIVNPVALAAEEREAVCYQCHLAASAKILRPGHSHFDFRPGMRLSDVWAVLDAGTVVDDNGRTRSVNHVQQLRDSRCFVGSDGKLGCTSCHDPHAAAPRTGRDEYYRERCLTCHSRDACGSPPELRSARNDSCIACHMPSLETSNMGHVAQTDHRILRTPAALGEESPATEVGELEFFADTAEALSPAERDRARALAEFVYAGRKSLPVPDDLRSRLQQLLTKYPHDGPILEALGQLARGAGDVVAAYEYLEQAAAVVDSREPAVFALLELSYTAADWERTIGYADQLLAIDPGDVRVLSMRGDALVNLARDDEGLRDVERAVELDPGSVVLRQWLVRQYQRLGRTEAVAEQTGYIERLQRVLESRSAAE
jgi:hypothetical protein